MIDSIFNLLFRIIKHIPGLKERVYRFYAWKIFEYIPLLKRLIYTFYDRFWFIELALGGGSFKISDIQSDNYEIDVSRLNYIAKFNPKKQKEWDRLPNLEKIEETEVYNVLFQHFIQNKKWYEIEGIKNILNTTLKYYHQANPINDAELPRFLENLDKLYGTQSLKISNDNINPIEVGIGRNGNYILLDDIFQVAVLKIHKIPNLLVHIKLRHPNWIEFCERFLQFQSIHGGIYQPLIHPDLKFKSIYSDKRFDVMKNNLPISNGKLLDIGANLGYFCHKFEELGFECYANEIRPSNVFFMKKLRDIEGKNFKIINTSIFELKRKNFDIILALNIFHHFLREKKLYIQLITFLNQLQLKYMYFQPHDPNEKIMQNAYKNFNNQQFVNFILKHSCLNQFRVLSENVEGTGRPIYLLSK